MKARAEKSRTSEPYKTRKVILMTLTGSSVDYSNREDTLEEVIKVGVIGCGYWGPKLARNIDQISGARLSMVADLQYDRLNEIKAQYPGLITTTNYNDLLDEHIDAVIVRSANVPNSEVLR